MLKQQEFHIGVEAVIGGTALMLLLLEQIPGSHLQIIVTGIVRECGLHHYLKTQVAIKRQGLPQSRNLAVLCYMLAESGSLPQTYSATLTGRTYTPSAA